MPGSWLLELLRMQGVPSVKACVAFKNHPYDPKGKLIFCGGDEYTGFHTSLGGLSLRALWLLLYYFPRFSPCRIYVAHIGPACHTWSYLSQNATLLPIDVPFTPEEMISDPLTTNDDEIQAPAFIGGFLSVVQWALNLDLQPLRCSWYQYFISHTGRGKQWHMLPAKVSWQPFRVSSEAKLYPLSPSSSLGSVISPECKVPGYQSSFLLGTTQLPVSSSLWVHVFLYTM